MTNSVGTGQHWVLLGTAEASKEVWGLRRIEFPCGYSMPRSAYALPGSPLERPRDGEVWAMAGLALEVGLGGKSISLNDAHQHVAGYRPWVCLFHHNVLDELREREHTIMIWDQGVSLFYGLWSEASQSLGDLISPQDFNLRKYETAKLDIGDRVITGEPPSSYEHDAVGIINFMSQFMTLSVGDIYAMGPLVAQPISRDIRNLEVNILGIKFLVEIK